MLFIPNCPLSFFLPSAEQMLIKPLNLCPPFHDFDYDCERLID